MDTFRIHVTFFSPESTEVTYCIVGDLTEQFELEV